MKTLSRKALTLLLVAGLATPVALFAADPAADEHTGHHPDQAAPTADAAGKPMPATPPMQDKMPGMQMRMEAMQTHMEAMQKTTDPQERMQMMKTHMEEMQAMMKEMKAGCPMAGGKREMGAMMDGEAAAPPAPK